MTNNNGESPPTEWATLDSGEREDYSTGARRDVRTGKGRYDLLPPFAIARIAGVYERGGAKYGDRNYEKGIPLTRYLDSALRHTFEVLEGRTDEDHAAQAAWNLLAFLQTQEMIGRGILPHDLADLPNYSPPKAPAKARPAEAPTQPAAPAAAVPAPIEAAQPVRTKRKYTRRAPGSPEPVRTRRPRTPRGSGVSAHG